MFPTYCSVSRLSVWNLLLAVTSRGFQDDGHRLHQYSAVRSLYFGDKYAQLIWTAQVPKSDSTYSRLSFGSLSPLSTLHTDKESTEALPTSRYSNQCCVSS